MQHAQPARSGAISFPKVGMLSSEQWLIGSHIITALAALSIGIFLGPFQIFRRAPILEWKIPVFSYYYQALTVHGVMNAIFFTTFFIVGFSYFVVTRSLQRDMWSAKLAWTAYWSMLVGILLVLYPLITNQANVLYTFYPSMVAHPTFYLGLVLLVVGTWMVLANILLTYRDW
ncbi:MAG: cbb3-type cytochrome c oxidase subunit I, partial [Bacteroidota bacterium]